MNKYVLIHIDRYFKELVDRAVHRCIVEAVRKAGYEYDNLPLDGRVQIDTLAVSLDEEIYSIMEDKQVEVELLREPDSRESIR